MITGEDPGGYRERRGTGPAAVRVTSGFVARCQKLLIEAGCDAEPIGHEQIQLRLKVTEDPASARREEDAKAPP